MHFSTSLVVLVGAAASVSARPLPHGDVNDVFPRELQYSDIAAMEGGAPDYWKHESDNSHGASKAQHDAYAPRDYSFWNRDHHDHPHHARHPHDHEHDHHLDERHPHPHPFPHPEDHHHGSARGDVIDNIVQFLSHEARSVPDVSSRVVQGIVDFLSHETRGEHEHRHEHGPPHEYPRHEHHNDEHVRDAPPHKVIDNILDFLASTVKR